MKKDYAIKFSSFIFLSSLIAVYFNGLSIDRGGDAPSTAPSSDPGTIPVSLEASSDLSFHHSSIALINRVIDESVQERAASIIESDPRFTQRNYINNNTVIADLSWPAVPRCSLSNRGESGAKVKMTLYYDINAEQDSAKVSLYSNAKNRLKVDLNLPGANVYFKVEFEKYRCGQLKWTRQVTATARGVRLQSDADFNFSGSDFQFVRLRNETIENLGWPDIESDAAIIDLIGEMVDQGSFVNNLCVETDCLNSMVIPLIKDHFNWNDMISPFVNSALVGIKDKLSETSKFTASGIGMESNVALKNVILGDGENISVLFDSQTSLNFNSDACAERAELVQSTKPFGDFTNQLKTGLGARFGTQLIEAMAFAVVKKGHLCKTIPLSISGYGTVNFRIQPEGEVFMDQGSYQFDQDTKTSRYREVGPSPWITTSTLNAGTDSALYLNVPFALVSSDPNISSTLKGVLKVYFNLDTFIRSSGQSSGVQLSIKQIALQRFTGSITAGGVSESATSLRPTLVAQLDKFKEKRIVENVQKKCHADRVEDPSQLTRDDYIFTDTSLQSIFYTEEKKYIDNCSNCSYNLNLDLSFLGEANTGDHISRYRIDSNSNLAFLFGDLPYGYSISSNDNQCPNLALTVQQIEDLERSREETADRISTEIGDQLEER